MRLIDEHSGIEAIGQDECIRLLGTEQVGRFAFVRLGAPEVLPVNYAMDGRTVVFATGPGSKLTAVERGAVAFEVDRLDTGARSGWSVVVHGDAREVTPYDKAELVDRLREVAVRPWADGDRSHLVRVVPRVITGRFVHPVDH